MGRAGCSEPVVWLAMMFLMRTHCINNLYLFGEAKVEAPVVPRVGISVGNTRDPEVMAGSTEASFVTASRARDSR